MSEVPDGLPTLSRGSHNPSEGHACVMEYVSVVAGEKFGDLPPCTNKDIAYTAQVANDRMTDANRHLLVPFIDRLASASEESPRVTHALRTHYINVISSLITELRDDPNISLPYGGHGYTHPVGSLRDAPNYWNMQSAMWLLDRVLSRRAGFTNETFYLIGRTPEQVRKADEARVKFLSDVLDVYEATVGRKPNPISAEALANAKRLIETSALA